MKTLVDNYQELKEKLKSRLAAAETNSEAARIVQDEINKLIDISSDYIQSLTPPQARLARTMLQSLNQYTNILTLVGVESPALVTERSQSPLDLSSLLSPVNKIVETQKKLDSLTSPEYYKQTLLQQLRSSRVLISGLLAGGLAGTLEGGVYWGLIGTVIGILTGGVFGNIIKQKPSALDSSISAQVEPVKSQCKVAIDVDKLLDYLYQALQTIDVTVAAYGAREEKTGKPGLENNLELLEYFQDLMAEGLDEKTQLPISVRRRIEQAATILRRYGIEARVYQPSSDDGDAWSMFYFEPSIDPEVTDYVTLKPAFVKDNQVLLPGSVIEPAS